jgi:hypothetical protein
LDFGERCVESRSGKPTPLHNLSLGLLINPTRKLT